MVEAQCLNPHNMGGTEFDKICKVATVAVLREFKVHTDSYAHLSLHRRDQGWRLRSRRECSV